MKRLILLLAAISMVAANSQEMSVATDVMKKGTGWGKRSLSIDHYSTTQNEDYDFSRFVINASYNLNASHSIGIVQGLIKKYNIPFGTDEFDFESTVLSYNYKLPINWQKITFRLGTSVTLPLSKNAIDHDKLSKVAFKVAIARSFFNKKFTLMYRPTAFYYLNEYKQSLGGYPLPQWGLGNQLIMSYSPIDRLSFVGVTSFAALYSYKGRYRLPNLPVNGNYSFDFYASYAISKDHLNVRLGYSQGNSLITAGRYEFYLFDERSTILSVGLDYYL